MKNICVVLLIFMLSVNISWAQQKSYYVSNKGNDKNAGTINKPFKNIDKLNQLIFKPGDQILLEANSTFSGNLRLDAQDAGTPEQPVKISSYGKGKATINANVGSGIIVVDAGGIVVENLIVRGDGYAVNDGSGVSIVNTLPDNQKIKYVRIKNIEVSGFGRDIFKNKTQLVGEQSPNGQGIFVGGNAADKSKSGFSDVLIEDCLSFENEFYGILITGFWQDNPSIYANAGVTIRNCTVHHNHGDPEYMDNHSGSGILMEDTDGGLIEYCVAYENGKNCSNPHGGPCGIWAAVANKIIIQYCESYQNRTNNNIDGDGFDLDGGATNSIMQYNYSHDNEGYGYLICSYDNSPFTNKNNIVRYNISVNDCQKLDGGSIHFWTNGKGRSEIFDTQVYGNTFYSEKRATVFFNSGGINNPTFANNIFISGGKSIVSGLDKTTESKFINNCYWSPDGNFRLDNFKTLDAWRKASGQEIYNGKSVGMFTDPLLTNPKSYPTLNNAENLQRLAGYTLQKNSPVINAGIDVKLLFKENLPKSDFYKNSVPQDNQFDIGACELKTQ